MIDRRTLLATVATTSVMGLLGCRGRDDARYGSAGTPMEAASSDGRPHPTVTGVVAGGLNVPWGVAFLPDGRALVAQRDAGSIVVVDEAAPARRRVRPVGSIAESSGRPGGEGGLLGLALDPNDASSLFAYVTTSRDDRVVRISLSGDKLKHVEPVLTGIPSGARHHGGRMVFGPDGHLYVGTGEAGRPELAQSEGSLGGKILRLSRDGEVEPWSMGHRNVEGLAFDDAGRLWASEFGDHRFDELNLITKGGNYGWPLVEGDVDDPRFVRPKVTWSTAECSPSCLAITKSTAFVAALRGERLWAVPLNGERPGKPTDHFVRRFGRLRTVVVAPSGDLWVTTSNTDGRGNATSSDDRILRVAVGAR
jgi:glucose/arabinose dehydrogenase